MNTDKNIEFFGEFRVYNAHPHHTHSAMHIPHTVSIAIMDTTAFLPPLANGTIYEQSSPA